MLALPCVTFANMQPALALIRFELLLQGDLPSRAELRDFLVHLFRFQLLNDLAHFHFTFVQTTPEVLKLLEEHRDEAVNSLIGSAFSEEIYRATQQVLETLRGK